MTDSNTPLNQQAEVFDGNVVFDNVFILNSLDYDFSNDDLTTRNLRVTGIATFGTSSTTIDGDGNTIRVGTALTLGHTQGLQFHTQNLHSTGFEVNQINVGGIATISSDLYLTGALVDTSGDTGSSGQLLSSTGSGTNWINANSTSVLNAINVGVNLNSTNANQFVSFFGTSSGNQPNRVDNEFTYNPSTNTLTVGTISATNIGGTGAFVTGMIIAWSGSTASIPTGFVLCDGNNGTPDLRGRFVVGHHPSNGDYDVDDTGGAEDVTLTIAQIPSHKHDTTVDNSDLFPATGQKTIGFGGAGGYPATTFTMSNTGGGQSHENRPPYYALCYIMKT